jgi:hypothetical protein
MNEKPAGETAPQTRPPRKVWRKLHVALFVLACLITLVAVFYTEENWRGKRAWDNYRRDQEARGEIFDRQRFIPPAVPDDQNFAIIPLLAPLFDFEPGTQKVRDTNAARRLLAVLDLVSVGYSEPPALSSFNTWVWPPGESRAWYVKFLQTSPQSSNSVAGLDLTNAPMEDLAIRTLAALAPANPAFDELRAGAKRPYSRFNIRYENDDPAEILLPHLGTLRRVCDDLQLQACAELQLGHAGAAFDDINLMFRIIEAVRGESILISQLVRFYETAMVLQPISEGLALHQWSDSQLQVFQQRLGALDFCADTKLAMQAERAVFGGGLFDYFRHLSFGQRIRLFDNVSGWPDSRKSSSFLPSLFMAAPVGWFYLEQLNYDRFGRDYLLPAIDAEKRQILPKIAEGARAKSTSQRNASALTVCLRHQIFLSLLVSSLPDIFVKAGRAQTGADLAAVACALERHRLARGQLPATLDALVPQFMAKLPHDVITGRPLHYRLTADGQFTLYGVGWNETDDGGVIATGPDGKPDTKNGDWVWTGPAK